MLTTLVVIRMKEAIVVEMISQEESIEYTQMLIAAMKENWMNQ